MYFLYYKINTIFKFNEIIDKKNVESSIFVIIYK